MSRRPPVVLLGLLLMLASASVQLVVAGYLFADVGTLGVFVVAAVFPLGHGLALLYLLPRVYRGDKTAQLAVVALAVLAVLVPAALVARETVGSWPILVAIGLDITLALVLTVPPPAKRFFGPMRRPGTTA